MNSAFFRLINTKKNLPENLAFARKIMVLPESGGAAAPTQPLARTPMSAQLQLTDTLTFKLIT